MVNIYPAKLHHSETPAKETSHNCVQLENTKLVDVSVRSTTWSRNIKQTSNLAAMQRSYRCAYVNWILNLGLTLRCHKVSLGRDRYSSDLFTYCEALRRHVHRTSRVKCKGNRASPVRSSQKASLMECLSSSAISMLPWMLLLMKCMCVCMCVICTKKESCNAHIILSIASLALSRIPGFVETIAIKFRSGGRSL